jgi:RNA polymerase sigma factor for flagellar operon FliA
MNALEEARRDAGEGAGDAGLAPYLSMVQRIAYKISRQMPTDIPSEDLVSAGMVGLTEAASRYDANQAASFATFATKRIRGAIIDEIRAAAPLSRDLAARSEELSGAVRTLQQRLGRQPDDAEISGELGLTAERYHQLLWQLRNVTVLSQSVVEEASGPSGGQDQQGGSPEDRVIFAQLRRRLADAVASLDGREQVVLSLIYRDELSLRQIGDRLGVCESRVCQLKTAAVHKLRAMLEEGGN